MKPFSNTTNSSTSSNGEEELRIFVNHVYDRIVKIIFERLDGLVKEMEQKNMDDKEQLNIHIISIGNYIYN